MITRKFLVALACTTVTLAIAERRSVGQVASQDGAKKYCSKWTAWRDSQPTSKPKLHVRGTCVFPTTGFSAKLQAAVPQGINPQIYILDLVIHIPLDNPKKHVVTTPVDYLEQTDKEYKEIQIMPDQVTVPVREVSAAAHRNTVLKEETISGCVYSIQDCTVLVTKEGKYYHLSGPQEMVARANAAKTVIRVTAEPGEWDEASPACKSEDVKPILIKSLTVTRMRCDGTPPANGAAKKAPANP